MGVLCFVCFVLEKELKTFIVKHKIFVNMHTTGVKKILLSEMPLPLGSDQPEGVAASHQLLN